MKEKMVLGVVLGVLALFGLRGILPDVFASVDLTVVIAFVFAAIAGYGIGRYTTRREPASEST